MEATIKIDDQRVFNALIPFLKALNITVITNDTKQSGKKRDRKQNAKAYSLRGTLLKYDDPFGAATDLSHWEVLK